MQHQPESTTVGPRLSRFIINITIGEVLIISGIDLLPPPGESWSHPVETVGKTFVAFIIGLFWETLPQLDIACERHRQPSVARQIVCRLLSSALSDSCACRASLSLHNLVWAQQGSSNKNICQCPAVALPPEMEMMTPGWVEEGWCRSLRGLNPQPVHKFGPSQPSLFVWSGGGSGSESGGPRWGLGAGFSVPSEKPLLCTSQQPIAAGEKATTEEEEEEEGC